MAYIGGGGGVRGGAHACLIGEQTALNALHQSGAGKAGKDRLEVKGPLEDTPKYLGQQFQIQYHHDDGHQHVQAAHERHQCGSGSDDPLAAPHDAEGGEQGGDAADDPRGDALVVEAVAGEGGLEVKGAQHVEAAGVSGNEAQGKEDRQGAAVESGLNIVGRAAVALSSLRIAALIDLGQGGLNKGSGAANDGNDPHPKHSAIAADADGNGHADDITCSHPGGGGYHQSLEGGDGASPVGPLGYHPQGFPEHPELDKAGAEGEIKPSSQQNNDEQIGVHEVTDCQNDVVYHVLHAPSLLYFLSLTCGPRGTEIP